MDETDMESKVEKNTCDQPNLVCWGSIVEPKVLGLSLAVVIVVT